MAEGAAAGDVGVMAADITAAVGAVNPDAAAVGGPGSGGVPMSPEEAQLTAVAHTFLIDLCAGLNREMAPQLSVDQLQQLARFVDGEDAETNHT